MQSKLEKAAAEETHDILDSATGEGAGYLILKSRFEKGVLRTVMQAMDGNQSQAAKWLGINRATLRTKLKRYGML